MCVMTVVLPVFTIVLPGPCTCVVFTDGTGALVFKYMLLVKDVEALCAGHTHVFWMMGNTAHMARHHFSTICQIIGVSTIVTCGSILPSHSFGHSHKFVNYVSPHEIYIVLSSVVCLSICLSVRSSFCHACMSALHVYLLNRWWDLQITLHKCQV